ncbi:hypothetical protein M9R32_02390 [Paenisporosarcina quisquiliarum]|uniref:LysM domain-containing protein n=1 Tax=Paenisporosarcina quisquiliarum TaxID=365346 RepID=A0A9X3RBW2_9BACL|nr:hypothetical protein [Paenisporosarcina quisquiliarum]MCZ8536040.1 hypothetical protein [Paenisporosarcina quisquiliarum]
MRIIGLAILILLLSYVLKVDLLDGTISLAAFSQSEAECIQEEEYDVFPVQTLEGDTVLSLFSVYPSEIWISFPERLEAFYKENPHLRNQTLRAGEIVDVPIYKDTQKSCS